MTGTLSMGEVGLTVGKLCIFLATALVLGYIAVPWLLNHVGRFKSDEMLLVTVLGLCFGFSLLAAKLGYSVALGAFVMGAVISEARDIVRIERLVEPIRDMFSAVFFVAIGLMIDPNLLLEHAVGVAGGGRVAGVASLGGGDPGPFPGAIGARRNLVPASRGPPRTPFSKNGVGASRCGYRDCGAAQPIGLGRQSAPSPRAPIPDRCEHRWD